MAESARRVDLLRWSQDLRRRKIQERHARHWCHRRGMSRTVHEILYLTASVLRSDSTKKKKIAQRAGHRRTLSTIIYLLAATTRRTFDPRQYTTHITLTLTLSAPSCQNITHAQRSCNCSDPEYDCNDINIGCTGIIQEGDYVVKDWDDPPLHLHCAKRVWRTKIDEILAAKKLYKDIGTTAEKESAQPSAPALDL